MIRGVLGNIRVRFAIRIGLVGLALVAFVPAAVAAEDAAAAEAETQQEEMESAPEPPGTLEFIGKNLIMKARGKFHRWHVVESAVDLDSLEDGYAIVEVDLSSVDTGIERRDKHLRTPDFFDTETYPVATVRIHSPQAIEDEEAEHQRYAVQFDVNLHGVDKTLEGEIELISTSPLVFEGNVLLDRTDFGVGPKPSGWSPMTPKAEIPVSFHIEL